MSTSMSALTAPISSSSTPDQRNLQWKSSNIGAKLLGKMGWKDGQAVGKRQRQVGGGDDVNGGGSNFSSEGLRLKKRIDGLGVGAEKSMPSHALGNNDLHADFSSVLASVSQHNSSLAKSSKKSKKEKKPLSLPKNKTTCHKVRRAKFQEKTEEDMKCIFGSSSIAFPVVTSGDSSAVSGEVELKKKKRKSKGEEDRKNREKKQKL
jgi:G-patch domain